MQSANARMRLEDQWPNLLERDEEGYLLNANDWHPGLIEPLAAESGLGLDPERLEIIRYIRGY